MTAELVPQSPERLYTANEVGKLFGTTRYWVLEHMLRDGSPPPDYIIVRGSEQPLWSAPSLDHWRVYFAGQDSIPRHHRAEPSTKRNRWARTPAYSDHRAVNQVGPVQVTWKLWWRSLPDNHRLWWFSTPDGWYASHDDGTTWSRTGVMIRPEGYRYIAVNVNVISDEDVVAALRSVEKLRQRLEGR